MLPYLCLDSLVLGLLAAPVLRRLRDCNAVVLAAGAADYLGTWAALHPGPRVHALACFVLCAALAAALVGWAGAGSVRAGAQSKSFRAEKQDSESPISLMAALRDMRSEQALVFWLGVAGLFGLDNLLFGADVGNGALVDCLLSAGSVALGMCVGLAVRRPVLRVWTGI